MDRAQKATFLDAFGDKISRARMAVVADYRGTTVPVVTEFRKKLTRVSGVEFRIVKNTLARRIVSGTQYEAIKSFLTGTNALFLSYDDVVDAAKVLTDFAKDNDKLSLKGGVLGGKVITADQVKALSEMPPKPVLQAQLLGVLNAPSQNLVSVLANANRQIVNVLSAYRDKLEGK
jgi:large subunit ribosomal protein L10